MLKKRSHNPSTRPIYVNSIAEQFDKNTIRPIIRSHASELFKILRQTIRRKQDAYFKKRRVERAYYLVELLAKDRSLHIEFRETIVAGFTTDEYHDYLKMQEDINGRIQQGIKRLILTSMNDLHRLQ